MSNQPDSCFECNHSLRAHDLTAKECGKIVSTEFDRLGLCRCTGYTAAKVG